MSTNQSLNFNINYTNKDMNEKAIESKVIKNLISTSKDSKIYQLNNPRNLNSSLKFINNQSNVLEQLNLKVINNNSLNLVNKIEKPDLFPKKDLIESKGNMNQIKILNETNKVQPNNEEKIILDFETFLNSMNEKFKKLVNEFEINNSLKHVILDNNNGISKQILIYFINLHKGKMQYFKCEGKSN